MTENYEKDFVPHEPSLALKELGFDEPCFATYQVGLKGPIMWDYWSIELRNSTNQEDEVECTTPLYQQAFRWFREKYNLKSFIQPLKNDDDIDIYVFAYGIEEIEHNDLDYLIHEEAELACLNKLIEIVKQQII
jgi:hypothetical protein